jgi:arylsulfatase A-like enzyme
VWMYFMPNGRIANVWDNHGGTAGLGAIGGYAMLKEKYCIPPLDRGLSALLEDLTDRGLLDETLVVVCGEFGRSPKINATQGREHWGACQTALLAGGGVRGGQVYGATDKQAGYVVDSPVSPEDFLATIYHGLGISPEEEIRDRDGRPYRLCEGKPVTALFA